MLGDRALTSYVEPAISCPIRTKCHSGLMEFNTLVATSSGVENVTFDQGHTVNTSFNVLSRANNCQLNVGATLYNSDYSKQINDSQLFEYGWMW